MFYISYEQWFNEISGLDLLFVSINDLITIVIECISNTCPIGKSSIANSLISLLDINSL